MPPVVAEGEFVRIRSNFGEWVAAGTPAAMDGFVFHAAAVLELPLPAPGSIDYAWMPDVIQEAPCAKGWIAGCAIGTSVYSALLPHEHELVHAVTAQLPRPDSFIEEGIHEALAGQRALPSGLEYATEMLGSDRTRDVDYDVAGRVMGYVLAEYGVGAVRELWEGAPRGSTGAEVASVFERITGVPFDTLTHTAFEQVCTAPPLFDCSAPALTWADGRIELEAELTANGQDTVGLVGNGGFDRDGDPIGRLGIHRTLRVEGPFDFATSREHQIRVRRCNCPEEPTEIASVEGTLDLPPGDYAVRFSTLANDSGPGWMTLWREE